MLRSAVSEQLDHDPHFRWRGEAVTRIENLSDIVFALALGMLVSASEIPKNWVELNTHMINIVPVALGFAVLLMIWNAHFTYFRRYGVADRLIIFLNAALLLVILFIAYPLRFIFDALFSYAIGIIQNDWGRMAEIGLMNFNQAGILMAYFTAGLTIIFALILGMYLHAMRNADLLGLSPAERIITRRSIWRYGAQICLGIVATIAALNSNIGPFAGFILNLNIPVAIAIRLTLKLPAASNTDAPDQNESIPHEPENID